MNQTSHTNLNEKPIPPLSAKKPSTNKDMTYATSKTFKELLETNNSDIDFIEKSDTNSIVNSPVKVINMSDTSSDKNFSEIGEESINLDNIDMPVAMTGGQSPTVFSNENSMMKLTEESYFVPKSSTEPRQIKAILKNQPDQSGDVILKRRDNLKCRSMLEERTQNKSFPTKNNAYALPSPRDKPPQLKRPKERPYSNYEQTNLIVKDDPVNHVCEVANCQCRRYSDINGCAFPSKASYSLMLPSDNSKQMVRQIPVDHLKNSQNKQRSSGLSAMKELQIQAYLNNSFTATHQHTNQAPNYENLGHAAMPIKNKNSLIKHSKTMTTLEPLCPCSTNRSKSLGGIRYIDQLELADYDEDTKANSRPKPLQQHNYCKYSQKNIDYMRPTSRYINESSGSDSEIDCKYSKPARSRRQHQYRHHHHHHSRHNRHHRVHRSRELDEEKKKRSSSCSHKQHREWAIEDTVGYQNPCQHINFSERNLNNEHLYYYQQEPLNALNCYQSTSRSAIKVLNNSASANEKIQFNNSVFLNDHGRNNNNLKLMPQEKYLSNELLRKPGNLQTHQQQQNTLTSSRHAASFQVKNKRLEQLKKPENNNNNNNNNSNKNTAGKYIYDPIIYSPKYNDLLTENASFIDSPIHLLMSHHKNQRMIKQQKYEEEKRQQQQQKLTSKSDPKIRFEDAVTGKQQSCVLSLEPITESEISKESGMSTKGDSSQLVSGSTVVPKNIEKQRRHKFLALLLTSLVTISSVYLFEIQSCLFGTSLRNLIIYQVSLCLTCLVYLYLMSTNFYWIRVFRLRQSQTNARLENRYFFNLFRCNQTRIINRSDETMASDELKDLMDITPPGTPVEFIHVKKTIFTLNHIVKSNFYLISLSLFVVNFWMLGSYINWYLVEVKVILASQMWVSDWVGHVAAVAGGAGTGVFFKTVIFDLFEINFHLNDLNIGDFSMEAIRNSLNRNKVSLLEDDKSQPVFEDDAYRHKREEAVCDDSSRREKHFKLVIDFIDKQQKAITSHYQKIILKFLIIIQSHWFLTLGFLAYIFKMLNSKTIQDTLNFFCYQTEVQGRTSKFCLGSLIADGSFSWQNEIISRAGLDPANNARLNKLPTLLAQNQTTTPLVERSKVVPTSDIYLVLITIALINFVVSLLVILFLVKSNKSKLPREEISDENCCEALLEKNESEEYLRVDAAIINHSNKTMKFFKLSMLHSTMPLMFFHGISKTVLINELMKMYVVCLNGTGHLLKLVFIYGCSSFFSIVILALLIVICNLKRSTTLIVLLFYWDPSRSHDIKTYYIGYIYFVCFAICNNLWTTHNLKTLLDKSYELNKSSSVVLFYGYSVFCLGSLTGYAATSYLCTTVKLYLTIFLLLLFSGIYIASEGVFYLRKKVFIET